MKKIAIVDPSSYSLPYDYFYIKEIAKNYEVDFYCSQSNFNSEFIDRIGTISNVKVNTYRVSNVNKFLGVINLLYMYLVICFKRNDYHRINFQWSVFPPLELLVFCLLKGKLIFTFHNSKPHSYKGDTYWFFKFISRVAYRNLFVSEYTKIEFNKLYNCSDQCLLRHGAMPLVFDEESKENQLDLNNNHDSSEPLRLVFWGNVKSYKGLEFLADNIKKLKDSNILLEVYGKFDNDQKHLIKLFHQYDVECQDAYIDYSQVLRILKNDALLVLPYKSASQSGIMYNCLAHNIPFICSESGETALFLKKIGLSKLVFSYGNIISLIDSIIYFSNNQAYCNDIVGDNMKDYHWNYSNEDLEAVFR